MISADTEDEFHKLAKISLMFVGLDHVNVWGCKQDGSETGVQLLSIYYCLPQFIGYQYFFCETQRCFILRIEVVSIGRLTAFYVVLETNGAYSEVVPTLPYVCMLPYASFG